MVKYTLNKAAKPPSRTKCSQCSLGLDFKLAGVHAHSECWGRCTCACLSLATAADATAATTPTHGAHPARNIEGCSSSSNSRHCSSSSSSSHFSCCCAPASLQHCICKAQRAVLQPRMLQSMQRCWKNAPAWDGMPATRLLCAVTYVRSNCSTISCN